ncbi:MAG TPA: glycosyltransferase family 39 protein, partial [Polyangiaceae bacterium]|nr:glycosyltransferase family 39 protein [Polyangiaceae bacterium]
MTETKTSDVSPAEVRSSKESKAAAAQDMAQDTAQSTPGNGEGSPPGTPAPAAEAKQAETGDEEKANTPPAPEGTRTPLIRRGNPLRLVRGGLTAVLASFFAFLLMAKQGQARWGVPLGAVFVLVATWGFMDLLGTFDDPDDRVATSTTLEKLARPLAGLLVATLVFCAALGFACAGAGLPQAAWGVAVTLTFVAAVAALYGVGRALGPWAKDETGAERPLLKRHGFWVVVAGAVLYFPALGTYSLWDPWETHYGEVAREMLARDDWISLWWAQDGWFWSKPVLDMWMQAVSMATLGVHYRPDQMLVGTGSQPVMHPEWAVRAPVVLLTILAMYLLYKGAAKTFGRRAAFLGSLVLATMPDWYFLAHQTMTDMPFVGAMVAAMGLVMLGLRADEEVEARAYEVKVGSRRFRLTAWHLVFGATIACALPQVLYLVSRNCDALWGANGHGFRPHWDEFFSGSGAGNAGLPGNEERRLALPASIPHSADPNTFSGGLLRLFGGFEPALQGLVWVVV